MVVYLCTSLARSLLLHPKFIVLVHFIKKGTIFTFYFASLLVCWFGSPSLCLVRFGKILRYADKSIFKITKVYIERNDLQVEFIRYRKC